MASLKFIIDMDVDDEQPSSQPNKGTPAPASPSAPIFRGQLSTSFTTAQSTYDIATGQHQNETYLSPATAAATSSAQGSGLGKIRTASLQSTPSGTAEPPSESASPGPGADRRLSTASSDSMDHTGYGSSSSMGGGSAGGMSHMNQPMRPMPNHPGPDIPIKLTPITGRVSRAKKGIPVHTCEACNKTFTRAEHLRRHQLSHQTPRFPCTYPNCDREFHRQDLLLRHQQKHEQDGDRASGRGGQRRGSSQSMIDGSSRGGYSSPLVPAPMGGLSPSTPVSAAGDSTTGSETGQQRGMGADGSGPAPISPNYGGDYNSPYSRNSISYPQGSMGDTVPISSGGYVPRTPGPGIPLFVVTRGLETNSHIHPNDGPPELNYDASPWASSDSSYSTTPATDNRGYSSSWVRGQSPATEWTQHLSPYPAVQDHRSLDPLATSHAFSYSPVTPSSYLPTYTQSHAGHHEYLDVPMAGYQHPFMGDPAPHSHTQSSSFSSVRSPSPNTSTTVSAETLVTPAPTLPVDRLGMLASLGRQKEMIVDVGIPMYHGASYVGAGGDSPEGVLVSQGLGGMGGCGSGSLVLSTPLPSTVRKAIPGFLESYWSRFHFLYPIVHRPTFEAAGEDVLRCAMAAVATQHLEGKEDRIKGNQLHEFAWQEARRAPQWTIQVMQAILLCEFFARFRGRKAAIRPSKLFESLYSRVSAPEFLSCSDGSFLPLLPGPSSPTSPFSDGAPMSAASVSSIPSFSWGSSPFLEIPTTATSTSTLFSSFLADFGGTQQRHLGSPLVPPSPTPFTSPSLRQQPFSSSSVASPTVTEQLGLTIPLQVLDFANQAGFYNQDQSQHRIMAEDHWRRWVHGETRRRLLSMCFFLDIHTSIYHEQPRTKDFSLSSGSMPTIPLIGTTTPLWNAPAVDSWNLAVSSNPAAMTPTFLPMWNDVSTATPFDRAVILAAEALRLPRRPRGPILPSSILPTTTNAPAPAILSSNSPALSPTTVPSLPLPAPSPATSSQTTQPPIDIAESTISRLFPDDPIANTYLALHHTPLLDLLAVSGDSWVLSQKVLPENSFVEHQKRLKSWADGRSGSGIGSNANTSAARATVYTARALGAFLLPGRRQPGYGDLSEYWAMHVCALICWAFGHGASRDSRTQVCRDEEVLSWVCDVGKMAVGEVSRVRGRKEAFGVVGVVRRRLEAECVGGRNRLFVDSVGTLKKLEEGANWKWF